MTTDAVRELGPHFAATGRTVELHSHCTIGLAPLAYLEGLRAGFDVLHTAVGPAGNGTSQPTAESTLRNLEAEGYEHALDTEQLARRVARTSRARARTRACRPGAPREYDAAYYHHQLPGGMVTTTRRMLEEIRRPELFDAVLDEVVRVRAEMGYPILVTPGLAARRVPGDPQRDRPRALAERLRRDGALLPRPLRRISPRRPTRTWPTGCSRCRRSRPCATPSRSASTAPARASAHRISDEELLLRLTMPQEQVDAMRAAPSIAERPAPGPSRVGAPLVRLLREVERRESISYLRVQKGDDLVVWRRAS